MARSLSSDVLATLLPPEIAVEVGRIDSIAGHIWPEEQAHVAAAVASRQAEFRAGRILARRALARLGGGDGPILAGADRAPVWPAGFTGSISHTHIYAAAAVGRLDDVLAIGIDVEEIDRFRPELESHIMTPEEISAILDDRPAEARRSALALAFCVKEAFYKCQYAITRQFLGFHDVIVSLDVARGEFALIVLEPRSALAGRALGGRFAVEPGLVAAAMVLRQDGRPWPERRSGPE
jgi:4'-phosphopantetheinyl transferase EntD